MFRALFAISLVILAQLSDSFNQDLRKPQEIKYHNSADNSLQPAMFFAPKTDRPVPLLVALHTWSGDYQQKTHQACAQWCIDKGWAYIHPNFRGPNRRPQATGSVLVVKDIISAVEYAKRQTKVDAKRIYLVGTSGGGYTALLMAGRAPKLWAGVSAWVPISDLRAWHAQCKMSGRRYWRDIELSCGGAPGASAKVDREYKHRLPLTWLQHAKDVNLDINAGIYDGHKGSVPISHSLLAFNKVAMEKDRIAEKDIAFMVEKMQVPLRLKKKIVDKTYGKKRVLFRRKSSAARVTVFEGGHELIAPAALAWLERQSNDRRHWRGWNGSQTNGMYNQQLIQFYLGCPNVESRQTICDRGNVE